MATKKTAGKKPNVKKGGKKGSKGSGKPSGGGDQFDDADPPIIVSGGGSVTIKSMNELTVQPGVAMYPYVYHIAGVDIAKMEWNGENTKKDKSKKGKDFDLKLFK